MRIVTSLIALVFFIQSSVAQASSAEELAGVELEESQVTAYETEVYERNSPSLKVVRVEEGNSQRLEFRSGTAVYVYKPDDDTDSLKSGPVAFPGKDKSRSYLLTIWLVGARSQKLVVFELDGKKFPISYSKHSDAEVVAEVTTGGAVEVTYLEQGDRAHGDEGVRSKTVIWQAK